MYYKKASSCVFKTTKKNVNKNRFFLLFVLFFKNQKKKDPKFKNKNKQTFNLGLSKET